MTTLTDEQRRAVQADGSVAVTAGAGTGKTYMLASRYVRHLDKDRLSPLAVVAATFTEKAAAELRSRIRSAVECALPGEATTLAELEAAPIGTLHALAGRICREHPDAAGVPHDFRILDEQEGALWLAEHLDQVLDGVPLAAYEAVPFSLLKSALQGLLKDPHAAERALACARANLTDLARPARVGILRELTGSETWTETLAALTADGDADALGLARAIGAGVLAGEVPTTALVEVTNLPPAGAGREMFREHVDAAVRTGQLLMGETAADQLQRTALPALEAAYQAAVQALAAAKRRARVLDYADLETGALRALQDPEVRDYYAARWKAFLIDEFQDTNPVQAELLERLTAGAVVTVVGDEKQSIYSFRRADVSVFRRVRDQIQAEGGDRVSLSTSYRMHGALVATLNTMFAPVLAELHEPLAAARQQAPHAGPHVRLYSVERVNTRQVLKPQRQRVEARQVALEIKAMLDAQTPIHDKDTNELRPMRPGDVAVLSRTWEPLSLYEEALAALGVKTVQTGGGNLLETREAQDARALLRFLAEPADDVALVALLRSPFFAVDDACLFRVSQALGDRHWWEAFEAACPDELAHAKATLTALLDARRVETPSRLLQLADRLCGYTAVAANLPGAARRLADWRGMLDLVRSLERETADVFHVARRLQRLIEAETEYPRPLLEAGDAVALMSIHAAKGLEWPVVVVPDLARGHRAQTRPVLFDATWGLALKLGEDGDSVLYTILKNRQTALEEAERRRVLYVAFTRARDHLILSATEPGGGGWELMEDGFAACGLEFEPIPYVADHAVPPPMPTPPARPAPVGLLLDPLGPGLRQLPVTALSEYARCPRRFRFRFLDGHPGVAEGYGDAARVGTLTHLALEKGLKDEAALAAHDPQLPSSRVREALELAGRFHAEPAFAPLAAAPLAHEAPFQHAVGPLVFNGVIDAVGPDFVLDFKTDRQIHPYHHRLQLGLYAAVMGKPRAHLAYLRHGQVRTFEGAELQAIVQEAETIAQAIAAGSFDATPSTEECAGCPYALVCDAQTATTAGPPTSPFLRGLRDRQPVGPMSDAEWTRAIAAHRDNRAFEALWLLVGVAPARWAVSILQAIEAFGWRPDSAGEAPACDELARLAAACRPDALAGVACLQGLSDRAPHRIGPADLARVEAALPLADAEHQAWAAFWLALGRFHLRFEVELEDREGDEAWEATDILLEEA